MARKLLIFGAEGGLGKGVVSTLVKKDFDFIYLFDFNKPERINEKSEFILIDDLTTDKNVHRAFENISASDSDTFFLFSTIGGFTSARISANNEQLIEKMLGMNFTANALILKHFFLLCAKCKGGSACFTAAYSGLHPEIEKSTYGASKAALIHLVKTAALEGKEIGVSVNAIAPYIINTQANQSWFSEAGIDPFSVIQPDETGDFIYSLFQSSHFISGNIIGMPFRLQKFFM